MPRGGGGGSIGAPRCLWAHEFGGDQGWRKRKSGRRRSESGRTAPATTSMAKLDPVVTKAGEAGSNGGLHEGGGSDDTRYRGGL
jgi:hypothetical protein